MPYTLKDPVRHKFPKPSYNKRTWAEYDKGLRARGDITIWFSEDAASSWNYVRPEKMNRGRQCKYSDFAIEAAHTLRLVFKQALRQTEGLLKSIIEL